MRKLNAIRFDKMSKRDTDKSLFPVKPFLNDYDSYTSSKEYTMTKLDRGAIRFDRRLGRSLFDGSRESIDSIDPTKAFSAT